MSYVVNGITYDEGGYQIDAFGHRIGGPDPNVAVDQALSATAATQHTTVTAVVAAIATAAQHKSALPLAPVMRSAGPTVQSQNAAGLHLSAGVPTALSLAADHPGGIPSWVYIAVAIGGLWYFRKSL